MVSSVGCSYRVLASCRSTPMERDGAGDTRRHDLSDMAHDDGFHAVGTCQDMAVRSPC